MRIGFLNVLLDFVLVDLALTLTLAAFRREHAVLSARFKTKHQRIARTAAVGTGVPIEFPPGPADASGLPLDALHFSCEPRPQRVQHIALLIEMLRRHRGDLSSTTVAPPVRMLDVTIRASGERDNSLNVGRVIPKQDGSGLLRAVS